MPVEKLKVYLNDNNVKYLTITHSPAYTAQEIAAKAHIPGRELAKTVMVKVDGKLAMAVLPASFKVDFEQLKKNIGTGNVELANEKEFENEFPDCDLGAMPPFGNLYGMDVYITDNLAKEEEIVFNACSYNELIKMPYKDFARLVKPKVIKFSYQQEL